MATKQTKTEVVDTAAVDATVEQLPKLNSLANAMADGGSKSLQTRAARVSSKCELALQNKINALENDRLTIEDKMAAMMDFAPDSTHSNQPGGYMSPDFNAANWVEQIMENRAALRDVMIDLDIAKKMFKELF